MKKLLSVTAILLLLLLPDCGSNVSHPDISIVMPAADSAEITTFPSADYGYLIYDPGNDETVKAHNLYSFFIPASVSKIFTAVLALEMLSPDYRFSTELLHTGHITDGELDGNLILKGGGDPELSIRDLLQMISELESRGIKNVRGHFYYNVEQFDSKESLDEAMPVNARYNTGFGPLNLNRNIIYALKNTDGKGRLTSCELIPSVPSNRAYLYDGPPVLLHAKYSNERGVETWGLPLKGNWENRLPLPVKNTGLFTSSTFRKLCSIHGITLPEPEKGGSVKGAKTIAIHRSRELGPIINDMLFSSDNLTAELTGTVAFKRVMEQGENKNATVTGFFNKAFPSVKWEGFRLVNYSGLTDQNRATPEQTAAMLIYLTKLDDPELNLSKLLPLSGIDGTMKSKLDDTGTAFRVYAKTGSIYYASALAGEFIANSGKKYFFTVYLDNKEERKRYALSGNGSIEEAKKAEKWSADAAKAIENFINKQIEEL